MRKLAIAFLTALSLFACPFNASAVPLTACGSIKSDRVWLQAVEVLQASPVDGFSFNEVCKAHDNCYDDCSKTQEKKRKCDTKLRENAENVCKTLWTPSGRKNCFDSAKIFYDYVNKSDKAAMAFKEAQAKCPSTAQQNSPDTGAGNDHPQAQPQARAQPPATSKGSVSGKVHKNSASGPALDGVSVTSGGKSDTTGNDGKFKLDGIAAGNSSIAFSKAGYDTFRGSVSIAAGKNADMGDRWLTESAQPPKAAAPKTSEKASPPRTSYSVCISNIDDSGTAKVNDHNVLDVPKKGNQCANITLQPGKNKISFKVKNKKGDYSYRFAYRENGIVKWEKSCGDVNGKGCNTKMKKGGTLSKDLTIKL